MTTHTDTVTAGAGWTRDDIFRRAITDESEAAAWQAALTHHGIGFHLDDNPADIRRDGERLFTDDEAAALVERIAEWDEFGGWFLMENDPALWLHIVGTPIGD